MSGLDKTDRVVYGTLAVIAVLSLFLVGLAVLHG